MTELISTLEAATMLRKSVRTVHRMISRGDLPATKLPGATGAYVLERSAVEIERSKGTAG
ncbi:MAG TPA: helix-turn-helix domain-containing protein [Microbacterium sp.]|nr:helix-turn-helix domain-containing protein [Microbacterium sp.]